MGATPTMPAIMEKVEQILDVIQKVEQQRLVDLAESKEAQVRKSKVGAKYCKKFARRQWRKELGDMFMYRGKFAPSFQEFRKQKRENIS